MPDNTAILKPDNTYHIYNRANGNEKLFLHPKNFDFFLEKLQQHIAPIADIFCYCLMPNHFHLLIRIKSENELSTFGNTEDMLTDFVSQQFSNFFNSYAKAINKQEGRKGSLFMRPYKRKKIESKRYLLKIVHYIHFNPVDAGLCKTPENYKYSSYSNLVSQSDKILKTDELISWFDGVENFIFVHKNPPKLTGIDLSFL